MNNMLKRLLVTALAVSSSYLSASTTNQGFMSVTRPQQIALTMDSEVARDLIRTNKHDRMNGNVLVRGYYSESTNDGDLGKYFGVNDKSSFTAVWGAPNDADVSGGYLVHDSAGANTDQATINFSPKTYTWGVELGYAQCLSKLVEGLHFAITLPIEQVTNNMNMTVSTAGTTHTAETKAAVENFFKGTGVAQGNGPISGTANVAGGQVGLSNALINGSHSETGVADVKVVVGYDFYREENWTIGANLGLTIPTGNTPSGKNVFEPLYGNGGHFELGLGAAVDGRLWHDGAQSICMHLSADYRYGFQADETRTLSISQSGIQNNLNQYFLVGVVGQNVATEAPLANSFTQAISITPGSSVRGNLGFKYGYEGFLFGLHYAPAWAEKESGTLAPAVTQMLVNVGQPTQTATPAPIALTAGMGTALEAGSVNAQYSLRQSQFTNRVGGDLGYTFKEWEYPVTLGLGGYYEFASDNAVAETWGVTLTAGIGF